jgi:hypothetical protein
MGKHCFCFVTRESNLCLHFILSDVNPSTTVFCHSVSSLLFELRYKALGTSFLVLTIISFMFLWSVLFLTCFLSSSCYDYIVMYQIFFGILKIVSFTSFTATKISFRHHIQGSSSAQVTSRKSCSIF